jgi:hypothetical protein
MHLMARMWEYATITLTRDPGEADWTPNIWLWLPGATEAQKITDVDFFTTLNALGSDGWEMVGMPSTQDAVFTYKAANDTWHDRAYWVEKVYWLKREKPR